MSTYSYKVIRKLNVIATGPEILHMAFVLFINNAQKNGLYDKDKNIRDEKGTRKKRIYVEKPHNAWMH